MTPEPNRFKRHLADRKQDWTLWLYDIFVVLVAVAFIMAFLA